MKTTFKLLMTVFLAFKCTLPAFEYLEKIEPKQKIVTATKRLIFENSAGAYNPSITKFKDNYLMTFRWSPNRLAEPWVSFIGFVLLDKNFDPLTKAELLDTRIYNNTTPSQAEDARVFCIGDKYYVVYNDNMDLTFPSTWERRDMYIAEIIHENDHIYLGKPLRLVHERKIRDRPWQKNWSPFEYNGKLLLSYSIKPHEILEPNLTTGICKAVYETEKDFIWNYDAPRGGTPSALIDGEYLSFFHSGTIHRTPSSEFYDIWHYYMGAYTFSASPPFAITKISSEPINHPEFYTYSHYSKRVIYPGGFVVDGANLYLSYGKDDCEIWIATIDLEELKKSLVNVK